MKKLKSLFIKFKSKVTITAYKRPLVLTILLLLFLNLLVVFVGSIVAFNLDPAFFNDSWLNALGTSFKWMISVHSINDVSGNIKLMICAAFIIALEMILFSGAMIATITAALRGFIDKMSRAKGKINLDHHFVILNWNSKVPELVSNLSSKGFRNNVIILCDRDKEYVSAQINSVLHKSQRKINLIVKEGNPLLRSVLNDISIEKASSVVIMSKESGIINEGTEFTHNDLSSLKILLTVCDFNYAYDPNIVIEMEEESAIEKVENLSKTLNTMKEKHIVPVSFTKKLGQLIAQTVVTPDISNVFFDLLSYEGVEFYSYGEEEVNDYLATHSCAIPIKKYRKLFVLAEDEKCLPVKRDNTKIKEQALKINENYETKEGATIFVVGDNAKHNYILENLNLSASYRGANLVIKDYAKDDIKTLINDIKNTKGAKKVIILSDDKVAHESLDANIFSSLIELHTVFPERENLSFITELLDSRNLNNIKDFDINNAIISNKIISLLLTQLAFNKDSLDFFNNLFLADDEDGGDVFDINIDYAKDILKFENELVFNSKAEFIHSFYHSFKEDCMPIGYIRNNERIYISSNQDKQEKFVIKPDDKIIYINY